MSASSNRYWCNTYEDATDTVTASAILVLEQQGKLSRNDLLSQHISELKDDIGDKVTLDQLLNHSAGLARDIEELDSGTSTSKRYVPSSEILEMAKGSRINFEPGSKFDYSNVGYSLLAIVIENVTGLDYKTAMDQLLFAPNGLSNTRHDDGATLAPGRAAGYLDLIDRKVNAPYEDKSYVVGAGSIMSSARDLFSWSRALFKGTVLSKSQRELLNSAQNGRYSYGWFVDQYGWTEGEEKKLGLNIHHDGGSQGFASKLSYLADHDITVIALTNVIPNKMNSLTNHLTNWMLGMDDPLPPADQRVEIMDLLWNEGPKAAALFVKQCSQNGQCGELPGSFDFIIFGRAYTDIHAYGKAEKIHTMVSIMRPDWEYGHLFLGYNRLEQGDLQAAYCYFKKTLELVPESRNARSEMGKLKESIDVEKCGI